MRKSELRRMEAKLRALETELDDAQMDEITDRAHEEYLRRCVVRDTRRNSRWKRYCRRVMVVAAATIALMVCSFAYTVMTPVTVSTANNAVRRAAIWVNDALQLGVEFPMPVDDGAKIELEFPHTYDSVESASSELNIPLISVDESTGFYLDKLEINESGKGMYDIQINYIDGEKELYIMMTSLSDENTIAMLSQENVVIHSSIGDITVWKSGETNLAVTVLGEYLIQIQGIMSSELFFQVCNSLTIN